MGYFIIWVVIIGISIYAQVQRQNRNAQSGGGRSQQGTQPNGQRTVYQQNRYPGNAPGGPGGQRTGMPGAGQPGYGNAGGYGQPAYRPAGPADVRKQQELKNRLQQRQSQKPQTKQGDILSRAAANVRENEADQLEQLMNTPGGLISGISGYDGAMGMVDLAGSSALMRELSDLMIMGYQPEPVSTRDFVAEGVEMLGRYEVSAGGIL